MNIPDRTDSELRSATNVISFASFIRRPPKELKLCPGSPGIGDVVSRSFRSVPAESTKMPRSTEVPVAKFAVKAISPGLFIRESPKEHPNEVREKSGNSCPQRATGDSIFPPPRTRTRLSRYFRPRGCWTKNSHITLVALISRVARPTNHSGATTCGIWPPGQVWPPPSTE